MMCLLLLAMPARAEPRIALVVGNADYRASLRPLRNPIRDAGAVASALRRTGFDVELVTDADGATMRGAMERFRDRLERAGPEATALFYYAGHGMQAGESNYLAPVDTATLERDAVSADAALERMEDGGARIKIVILDACRDDPSILVLPSGGRGFRRMSALERGREIFIAYSTTAGQTATDGVGDHSPFAEALAREMMVPGQAIETTFRQVRAQVVQATRGVQTPWDSNSLTTAFTFAAAGTGADASRATIEAISARAPLAPPGARQVRDFEAVPTASAPNFMVAAQPYLRDGPVPIRVRDVHPAGSEVVFQNNRGLYQGNYAAPTLSQNMLTQFNTGNVAASFTLVLPRPARRVHFMIPRLFPDTSSGVTAPAWTATALGATGNALDSRSRELARSMTLDLPSEVISLQASSGEGITAIRFESDPRLNMVPFAATSALLIEGMWIEPMEEGSAEAGRALRGPSIASRR